MGWLFIRVVAAVAGGSVSGGDARARREPLAAAARLPQGLPARQQTHI